VVVAQASQFNPHCTFCPSSLKPGWKGPHHCAVCLTPQPVTPPVEGKPLNFFEVFGLQPAFGVDATLLEARYIELAKVLHPDRYQNRKEALEHSLARQSLINDAFKVLKSESLRRSYVLELLLDKAKQPKQVPPLEIAEQWFEVQESLLEGEFERVLGFRQMLSVKRSELADQISRLTREFDQTRAETLLPQVAELLNLSQYLDSLERDLEQKLEKARRGST
jgi:molecular chaperone HscB